MECSKGSMPSATDPHLRVPAAIIVHTTPENQSNDMDKIIRALELYEKIDQLLISTTSYEDFFKNVKRVCMNENN